MNYIINFISTVAILACIAFAHNDLKRQLGEIKAMIPVTQQTAAAPTLSADDLCFDFDQAEADGTATREQLKNCR